MAAVRNEISRRGVEAPKSDKVKVKLPRARGSEPREVFVGINGTNYLVPRGQEVEVPAFVADEIMRAEAAENFMNDEKERMLADAK